MNVNESRYLHLYCLYNRNYCQRRACPTWRQRQL